jgi:transcriptional regulator with XRE-family HTH domain
MNAINFAKNDIKILIVKCFFGQKVCKLEHINYICKNLNDMIKQKLIDERKKKFTQEEFAFKLGMDASNYNRRENGLTKISKKEWDKMAKELNVKLEDIYEPEDGVYIINGDNAMANFNNGGTFNNLSDFAIETMKKYIQKLEEETKVQKEEIERLKLEVIALKK